MFQNLLKLLFFLLWLLFLFQFHEIGKGRVIKEGKKVALINFGTRLEECKKASEELLKRGIDCTIIDARFAKPLDEKLIMEVASNHD